MKSLVFVVACLSVVGVVACSGSSEHRSARNTGAGGEEYSADGEDSESGGSREQAGKGGSTSTTGSAGSAGEVGGGAGRAGGNGEAGTGEGGTGQGGTGQGGSSAGGEGGVGPGIGGGSEGGVAGTNDGGVGGASEGGVAGEAGTAGVGGEGGEGGAAPYVDPVCGANMIQVGAYSLWCGKVNMHQESNGDWTHDADCKSGCNIAGVGYCQKFYPTTTTVVAVDQTMSVVKDWKNAYCDDSYPDGKGISGEAACCAPYPSE